MSSEFVIKKGPKNRKP